MKRVSHTRPVYGSRSAKKARRGSYRRAGPYRTPRAGRVSPAVIASLGVEKKFFDGSKGNTSVSATGTITDDSLVEIPQGDGESNRDGRKVIVKSIHVKGLCKADSTSAPTETGNRIRIIMYLDKQVNGATAAVTDLLEDADINGFRNLTNSGRFTFLYDRSYDLNNMAGAFDGTNDQFGELHLGFSINKTVEIPVQYNSTAGAITEITSNNIGMLFIDEEGNSTVQYRWRVRFVG